jgi:hypothetical protein
MEVFRLVEPGDFAQARTFRFQPLFDFLIILNVNEMGCHIFLRQFVPMQT